MSVVDLGIASLIANEAQGSFGWLMAIMMGIMSHDVDLMGPGDYTEAQHNTFSLQRGVSCDSCFVRFKVHVEIIAIVAVLRPSQL